MNLQSESEKPFRERIPYVFYMPTCVYLYVRLVLRIGEQEALFMLNLTSLLPLVSGAALSDLLESS
jgi:ABC-type proline/glycine betaine transport system permease subunit